MHHSPGTRRSRSVWPCSATGDTLSTGSSSTRWWMVRWFPLSSSMWMISLEPIVRITMFKNYMIASNGALWHGWKLEHRLCSKGRNCTFCETTAEDTQWRLPWPSSSRPWTVVRSSVADCNSHLAFPLQNKRSWEVYRVAFNGQQPRRDLRSHQWYLLPPMERRQQSMTWSRSMARSTSSRPLLRMASWSRMWQWVRTVCCLATQMPAGQMRRSQDHRLVWSLAWQIRRPWHLLRSLQCLTGSPREVRGCADQHWQLKLQLEMRQQIGALLRTFSFRSSCTSKWPTRLATG